MSDYERIAEAIKFITQHAEQQPQLDEIAQHLHLSPFHFQRLFSRWVGVSPKRFLQILTIDHAKQLLTESRPLLDISHTLGLSSGSRLYDHFIQLEAVTPGEFRQKGSSIHIHYGTYQTPFGDVFVAETPRGICQLTFLEYDNLDEQLERLTKKWPLATLEERQNNISPLVNSFFDQRKTLNKPLSLHVAGTNFQVSVWRALLQIPSGSVASYGEIAKAIGKENAVRAVGTAIGANPISLIIPCHRVIQQSGKIGGYRWGEIRKHAIHAWEMADVDINEK